MKKVFSASRRFLSILLIVAVCAVTACSSNSGYFSPDPDSDARVRENATLSPDQRIELISPDDAVDLTNSRMPGTMPDAGYPGTLHAPAPQKDIPVKVALLLPLSRQHSQIGQALLQSAQLAVFDVGYENFTLVPKDTQGTQQGAVAAAEEALREGAQLILGPLFADNIRAIKPVTRQANVTIVGFSTDWRVADDTTFLIGILPFGQADRIATYASEQGYVRVGMLIPEGDYGLAVANAFQRRAADKGLAVIRTTTLNDTSLTGIKSAVSALMTKSDGGPMNYDAIFMPLGGDLARTAAGVIKTSTSAPIQLLGTGLWDDTNLLRDPNLQGAVYAAPTPEARNNFEQKYTQLYGAKPPRIASIAYDATALAVVLAKTNEKSMFNRTVLSSGQLNPFSPSAITNPNGFSGIDGVFRFRTDGLSERGLAVNQINNGTNVVVDRAPSSFVMLGKFGLGVGAPASAAR